MKTKRVFSLFILIMMMVTACLGAVSFAPAVMTTNLAPTTALGAGETFAGMKAAMGSCPGCFIMEKGQMLLFAWPRASEYAFAIIGKTADLAAPTTGLKINTLSLSMMVKSLEDGGWSRIGPAQVPAAVTTILGMLTIEMAATATKTLPTVFLVPAVMFQDSMEIDS